MQRLPELNPAPGFSSPAVLFSAPSLELSCPAVLSLIPSTNPKCSEMHLMKGEGGRHLGLESLLPLSDLFYFLVHVYIVPLEDL